MSVNLRFALRCLLLASGVALVTAAVVIVDAELFGQRALAETAPRFEAYFVLRSALALTLAWLVVSNIYRHRDHSSAFQVGWNEGMRGTRAITIAGIALALLSAALMLTSPNVFDRLGREDSVVEWASAVLLFVGSFGLAAAAVTSRGRASGISVAALVLCGLLFLIAMEEVSWFQRVLGITTPPAIAEINRQNEINLHNVFTDQTENAYYFFAFTYLVLLPFLAEAAPHRLVENLNYVPSRFVVVLGSMTTSFSYEMWNIFWLQFSAFVSVAVLMAYVVAAIRLRRRSEAIIFASATVVLVAIHLVVILAGPSLERSWGDTEFKELFLALGLAIAALEMAGRLLHKQPAAPGMREECC